MKPSDLRHLHDTVIRIVMAFFLALGIGFLSIFTTGFSDEVCPLVVLLFYRGSRSH
jgi:ABC-type Mn2+/Zn2+ transport system permease subunit